MRSTRPRLRAYFHGRLAEARGPFLTGTAARLERRGFLTSTRTDLGDMFIALHHIEVILVLFDVGCSTPTSLVFSSPENAVKDPLGAALSTQSSLNASLTDLENVTNAILSPAPVAFPDPNVTTLSSYIRYKVHNSKVTIEFHSFGPNLASQEAIFTIVPALSKVLPHCVLGKGDKPIVLGYFRYTHEFDNGNITRFSVADFREDGRPMTWSTLADTLKGMSDFMKDSDRGYREVSFEVEEDGVGYVGSGYLELVSSPSPTLV